MEEVKSYKTLDGKLFTDIKEAEQHEAKLKNVKTYEIFAKPDLNEGRSGAEFQGYVRVNAKERHELFLEDWLYKKYGSRAAFVQGHYGSNAIVENWRYRLINTDKVNPDKILASIQDLNAPTL